MNLMNNRIFEIILITYFTRLCKSTDQHVLDPEFQNFQFPKGFLFGVGTSSFQTEGAWNVDGKGANIWDTLAHEHPEYILDFSNPDDACKSYYKYKEDVQNVKDLQFNMYQISISWSRILPDGTINNINKKGVDFYHKFLDEMLEKGIQPMVAIYHFDLPQALEDYGGWTNRSTVHHFAEYSDLLFRLYGHKVKFWLTLVEPTQEALAHVFTHFAPSIFGPSSLQYLALHHMILAHAAAYRLYERKYKHKQNGMIGVSQFVTYCYPLSKTISDIAAARRYQTFNLGWFIHAIYSKQGDYPRIMREYIDRNSALEGCKISRLPRFTKEEIEFVKGTCDFLGINYYTSGRCTEGSSFFAPPWTKDGNVIFVELPPSAPSTTSYWQKVDPEGLYLMLDFLNKEYNYPRMFITENGYSGTTGLIDDVRINFAKDHLAAVLKAIKQGSRIIGYIWWSLMDTFELNSGYTARFGLLEVNFTDPNRTRTKRKSALFFKRLNEYNNGFN